MKWGSLFTDVSKLLPPLEIGSFESKPFSEPRIPRSLPHLLLVRSFWGRSSKSSGSSLNSSRKAAWTSGHLKTTKPVVLKVWSPDHQCHLGTRKKDKILGPPRTYWVRISVNKLSRRVWGTLSLKNTQQMVHSKLLFGKGINSAELPRGGSTRLRGKHRLIKSTYKCKSLPCFSCLQSWPSSP